MYVCICNAVCDKRIKNAITEGNRCSDTVYQACGVEAQCGCCREEIEDMIDHHEKGLAMSSLLAAE